MCCSVAELCPTLWPRGLQHTRLLRPWDSPGKNTGVGCHFLLQRRLSTAELMLWNCGTSEDSPESLDWEIKPVNPKGINPEYSLETPLLELQHPILWPLDARSWLTGKDLCWEDLRQKKREAKNEMVRQHHRHNGHKSEQTLGDSGGQRSLIRYIQSMKLQSQTWLSNWTTTKYSSQHYLQ